VKSTEQTAAESEDVPPGEAFALFLETACREFETLGAMLLGEIQLVASKPENAVQVRHAAPTIRMALAKSFLFNTNRAHRICLKNKAQMILDRVARKDFLRDTEPVTHVRNVNEHGFDGDKQSEKSKRSMYEQEGGFLDETALVLAGPKRILMGPLNLSDVYRAVARARNLAGFGALPPIQPRTTPR
jgi:hypothetical protein